MSALNLCRLRFPCSCRTSFRHANNRLGGGTLSWSRLGSSTLNFLLLISFSVMIALWTHGDFSCTCYSFVSLFLGSFIINTTFDLPYYFFFYPGVFYFSTFYLVRSSILDLLFSKVLHFPPLVSFLTCPLTRVFLVAAPACFNVHLFYLLIIRVEVKNCVASLTNH